MRHYCPPDMLDDLAEVLAEVRTWAQLDLPRPVSPAGRRALLRALWALRARHLEKA